MKYDDSRLVRHLAIAVALKLLVLALLWWAFARADRASVDAEAAAQHIGTLQNTGGAKP
jgi:hypothetical protein